MNDFGHDPANYKSRGWKDTSVHQATINGEPSLVVHCEMPEGTDGDASSEGVVNIVRISENLRGREYLETRLHEHLHCAAPLASEEWVTQTAHELSTLIFETDCRRRSGLT